MAAEALELELVASFAAAHPDDAARVMEAMGPDSAAEVLRALPTAHTAELLRYLPTLAAAQSLERLDVGEAATRLAASREDVAAAVLRATERQRRAAVLEALDPARRKRLEALLRYREGTAGSLLDPRVLTLPEGLSVGEALDRVRSDPEHSLYYVYLVGDENELTGVVTLRQLMLAPHDEPVATIATGSLHALRADTGWDSILAHPGWHRVPTLPVVDDRGRFLGIVRYESVRELQDAVSSRALGDPTARTAAALGDLYGVGMRGLLAVGQSLLGSDEGSS